MATLALDSNTLGLLAHPRPGGAPEECRTWLEGMQAAGCLVLVPEVVDYELRRELLRIGSRGSIARLDFLKRSNHYLALTTPAMLRAAELWAVSRRKGAPTAHPERLDIDVILAAQIQLYVAAYNTPVVVATTNLRHLRRFVDARPWQDIRLPLQFYLFGVNPYPHPHLKTNGLKSGWKSRPLLRKVSDRRRGFHQLGAWPG